MSWLTRMLNIVDGPAEQRMITTIPGIDRPGSNMLGILGIGDIVLPNVTVDSALTVPAFQAGVAFLSRSMAALPKHVYRNTANGPEKVSGGLQTLVHEAPNAEWTSFKLWQYFWHQVFSVGRGLIWIERSGSNITGLYAMNPRRTQITRDGMGRTQYQHEDKIYPASDVIDVPFMLRDDGLGHYGPVALGFKALQLALAMNDYASTFFAGGGVPPLAVEGPLPAGPEAMKRASNDIMRAIDAAKADKKPIVQLPPGYSLKPIGFDPDKGQMTDARRFQIEEIARVLQLPPVFLQDLSHGTFSNTEQQDLHLVKHNIAQWARALEEELNLKLFGQRNGGRYVQHNLDGLMRGDFTTRMEGLARAVQTSIITPDEARALENRPAKGGNADKLFMQGATTPIDAPQDPTGGPVNAA